MAHDSGPAREALDAETIDALRAALEQYAATPSRANTLAEVLRRISKEAHEKSVLPEHLLMVVKDVWNSLPSVRGMSEPADQVKLLQRVVTMAIKEYYAA